MNRIAFLNTVVPSLFIVLALPGAALLVACTDAKSESTSDTTTDEPNGLDAASSETPEPASSAEPTSTAAPSQTTAPTQTTTTPGTAPGATSAAPTPVAPGEPEVLLADLALPGRIALDGDNILLADRVHFVDEGLPDRLLSVPKSGGAATVVLEAPSIEGFVLDGDRIWINSYVAHAVLAFDLNTAEQVLEVPITGEQAVTQIVAAEVGIIAAVSRNLSLFKIDKTTGEMSALWDQGARGSATWLQVLGEQVIMPANYEDGTSVLVGVQLDGSSTKALLKGVGALHGVAVSGSDVFVADGSGVVTRVTPGVAIETAAEVPKPWALLVDGPTLYVSSQPEYCSDKRLGSVYAVPLPSGEPVEIAAGQRCPSALVADDQALYWVNNGDSLEATDIEPFTVIPNGTLMRLSR